MRAIVQRVTSASVVVDGKTVGAIGPGICVLVGVGRNDTEKDAEFICRKVVLIIGWSFSTDFKHEII